MKSLNKNIDNLINEGNKISEQFQNKDVPDELVKKMFHDWGDKCENLARQLNESDIVKEIEKSWFGNSKEEVLNRIIKILNFIKVKYEVIGKNASIIDVEEDDIDQVKFKKLLEKRFNNKELKDLIFELNESHEDIIQDTNSESTLEIIKFFYRRGKLPQLFKLASQKRQELDDEFLACLEK